MIQRTLVLIKPDGVKRGLTGRIIRRFENCGLKIIGLKQKWVDKEFAKKHYTEDVSKRRGEHVRIKLLSYLTEGPVVAIVLEGVNVVETVRKITGDTEPRVALPGTIRGDYAHVSYHYADGKNKAVKNLIHASGNEKEAKKEINLWFKKSEIHSYSLAHDDHVI